MLDAAISETYTVTFLCTDLGNHGRYLLVPKFWSAMGIRETCKSTGTSLFC